MGKKSVLIKHEKAHLQSAFLSLVWREQETTFYLSVASNYMLRVGKIKYTITPTLNSGIFSTEERCTLTT